MDDPGDRGYSRAPELEDLVSLCKALNDHGVRYLLLDGFASSFMVTFAVPKTSTFWSTPRPKTLRH